MKTKANDGSQFPTLQRQNLRMQVQTAIEDLIIYGVLEPGAHLAEEVLAERLGVSRQPVREALQTLAVVGFVDLFPGRGAFVHQPTSQEAQEVFHVRAILEADGCRLAALNRTDSELEALEGIYTQGLQVLENDGDPRQLIDLNTEFHDAIMQIAGNKVSLNILQDLRRRIGWYLVSIIQHRAPSSWREHREILDAISAGDEASAHELMKQHVTRSLDLISVVNNPAG